jgi:hypothetical protein
VQNWSCESPVEAWSNVILGVNFKNSGEMTRDLPLQQILKVVQGIFKRAFESGSEGVLLQKLCIVFPHKLPYVLERSSVLIKPKGPLQDDKVLHNQTVRSQRSSVGVHPPTWAGVP